MLEVIHGAYDAFLGKEIDYAAIEASGGTKMVKPSQQAERILSLAIVQNLLS